MGVSPKALPGKSSSLTVTNDSPSTPTGSPATKPSRRKRALERRALRHGKKAPSESSASSVMVHDQGKSLFSGLERRMSRSSLLAIFRSSSEEGEKSVVKEPQDRAGAGFSLDLPSDQRSSAQSRLPKAGIEIPDAVGSGGKGSPDPVDEVALSSAHSEDLNLGELFAEPPASPRALSSNDVLPAPTKEASPSPSPDDSASAFAVATPAAKLETGELFRCSHCTHCRQLKGALMAADSRNDIVEAPQLLSPSTGRSVAPAHDAVHYVEDEALASDRHLPAPTAHQRDEPLAAVFAPETPRLDIEGADPTSLHHDDKVAPAQPFHDEPIALALPTLPSPADLNSSPTQSVQVEQTQCSTQPTAGYTDCSAGAAQGAQSLHSSVRESSVHQPRSSSIDWAEATNVGKSLIDAIKELTEATTALRIALATQRAAPILTSPHSPQTPTVQITGSVLQWTTGPPITPSPATLPPSVNNHASDERTAQETPSLPVPTQHNSMPHLDREAPRAPKSEVG